MASAQNVHKESPPLQDDDILDPTRHGNSKSPPQLDPDVVKVVVVGEPGCGKTTFIRQYYDNHSPSEIYSHNGITVYNCVLQRRNQQRKTAIFEFPGHADFTLEQRIPYYEDADIIVFMYAVDDPISLEMLNEKWLVETINIIHSNKLPVFFVGNKHDQQVLERLALENKSPVTLEQGTEMLHKVPYNGAIMECSSYNLEDVQCVFGTVYAYILLTD